MTLSFRQWTVLGVLIVGFAVAALVARGGGGDGLPPIDTVQWCSNAEDLEGTGALLTGEADAVTSGDADAVKEAIFAVEIIAPYEIRADLARLADFAIVLDQQLADDDWPAAFDAARQQVDTDAVDSALVALETEMQRCGLELDA